jgi:hypothetical protein
LDLQLKDWLVWFNGSYDGSGAEFCHSGEMCDLWGTDSCYRSW